MDRTELLRQIRERVGSALGPRCKGLVLYGSSARGQARPDSDMDLLVLLEGPVDAGRDIDTIVRALYPLQLETPERPIHVAVADIEDYQAGQFALYRNAKAEGVPL